jgi:hypothetical protein
MNQQYRKLFFSLLLNRNFTAAVQQAAAKCVRFGALTFRLSCWWIVQEAISER